MVKWDELTNMFEVADKEFGGCDIVSFCVISVASFRLTNIISGLPRRRYLRTTMVKLLVPAWHILL